MGVLKTIYITLFLNAFCIHSGISSPVADPDPGVNVVVNVKINYKDGNSDPEPDVCQLPADGGICEAYIPSYYFNSKSGKCEEFIYGGCEGNDNNFKTIQECIEKCDKPNLVNCFSETYESQIIWQNTFYPKTESLPGKCPLTLKPADGTCAYRLYFDNMDLNIQNIFTVSTINYNISYTLTGHEGIVVLPQDSSEYVGVGLELLLLTDLSEPNFRFRVTISSLACGDIKTYTSPRLCGIQKEPEIETFGKFIGRSDISEARLGTVTPLSIEATTTGFWYPKHFESPWMVLIKSIDFPDLICNGVLLDDSHVITAVTCMPGVSLLNTSLNSIRVIIGVHKVPRNMESRFVDNTENSNGTVRTVIKITFSMSYSQFGGKDNIAVLTLNEPVAFDDYIRPVCLPVSNPILIDTSGMVSGWLIDPTICLDPLDRCNVTKRCLEDKKVRVLETCDDTIWKHLDDYLCTKVDDEITDKVEEDKCNCAITLGSALVRQDMSRQDMSLEGAYYLSGLSTSTSPCITEPSATKVTHIFSAIKPDDTFLNLALAG